MPNFNFFLSRPLSPQFCTFVENNCLMDFFTAVLTILFILIIGIIPFFLIYGLADLVGFVLFRVTGYRRQVVEQNLRESFPEQSDAGIQKLMAGSYKNLADVLVEGLKAFTMTRKQIRSRHKVLNPEVSEAYYKAGKSVIGTPCHYGNWEWGSMSGSLQLSHRYVVMYKPLANKWIDRYVRWSRAKYGGQLVSIFKTAKIFRDKHDKTTIFIMAADQSPSNASKAIWVDFLGRQTAFLHGPEFYAKKYNLPVVFVDIQRKKRGFYELTLEVIADNPKELPPGEITQRYARKLEEAILNKPENWLWSHRRWKHEK